MQSAPPFFFLKHMKKILVLVLASIAVFVGGCTSVDNTVSMLRTEAQKVGNVKYVRSGIWSDSNLEVTVDDDGTRSVHYKSAVKAPGGPSIDITIDGIKPEDNSEDKGDSE